MDPEELWDRGVISTDEFRRQYEQQWTPPVLIGFDPAGGGGGGGGGSLHFGGGGGGGGGAGFAHLVYATDNTNRLVPITSNRKLTEEERQEMAWSDRDAQEIARDILREQKKEGLREKVTAAVAGYREMLAGANCGSVFSFMKVNEKGDHYWYAAIKNGSKWYTTAQSPRVLEDDDAFIEWLVLLQAYESEATELTQGAAHKALELGPIDATATDES